MLGLGLPLVYVIERLPNRIERLCIVCGPPQEELGALIGALGATVGCPT